MNTFPIDVSSAFVWLTCDHVSNGNICKSTLLAVGRNFFSFILCFHVIKFLEGWFNAKNVDIFWPKSECDNKYWFEYEHE